MHYVELTPGFHPSADATLTVNRWIGGSLELVTKDVTKALNDYRLHDAANILYSAVRHTFCDWYIEFTKSILNGQDEVTKAETRATMAWSLKRLLTLLHPIMPFVTDQIWAAFRPEGAPEFLLQQDWPSSIDCDQSAIQEMEWVIQTITAIRGTRSELGVPVATFVETCSVTDNAVEHDYLIRNQPLIERLARTTFVKSVLKPLNVIVGKTVFQLNIRDVIDLDAERARLQKEKTKVLLDIKVVVGKLSNADFMARAPEEIIAENQGRNVALKDRLEKIEHALAQLEA
jgi:valyl-tRNA synthetase